MNVSEKIIIIAKEVFFEHFLPAIIKNFPELENKFLVNITSSVAYQTADQYSDLDMFLIFYSQSDYRKYSAKIQRIIKQLKINDYSDIFDKGVRLEIESLSRAGVSGVIHNPKSRYAWYTLPNWLMYWFVNSITIYDPMDLMGRLRKNKIFYPRDIQYHKILEEQLLQDKNSALCSNYFYPLDSYVRFEKFVRYINALLDTAFLVKKSFIPHLKWKEHIFFQRKYDKGNRIKTSLDVFFERFTFACEKSEKKDMPKLSKRQIVFVKYDDLAKYGGQNKLIYTPIETGIYYANHQKRYHVENSISCTYKWYTKEIEPSFSILYQCALYYNFIIWRDIRVLEKTVKRQQKFTRLLYFVLVIQKILETLTLISKVYLPPMEFLDIKTLKKILSPLPPELAQEWILLLSNFNNKNVVVDINVYIVLFWSTYKSIQILLKDKFFLPEKSIIDPLSTQFKIQYWKYENLFL